MIMWDRSCSSSSVDNETTTMVPSVSLISRAPPTSSLFPYTTLFRSRRGRRVHGLGHSGHGDRPGGGGRSPCPLCPRSEEHTSELQSPYDLVCRLQIEKKMRTPGTIQSAIAITNPSSNPVAHRLELIN